MANGSIVETGCLCMGNLSMPFSRLKSSNLIRDVGSVINANVYEIISYLSELNVHVSISSGRFFVLFFSCQGHTARQSPHVPRIN